MAKKACRCKPTECEECAEWIFTFADLVMLMMGFFVILWVLKPAPGKKTDEADEYIVRVAAAIREAFGYVPNPASRDPVDMQMIINGLSKVKENGPGNAGKINQEPKGPEGSDRDVTNIRPSRQATEGGKFLFARGSAELTDATKQDLRDEANIARGHRTIVLVKGYTSLDDLPDDATEKEKMDLSLRRAEAAAQYLIDNGIDPSLVRVQGCSTFEPLVEREYTPDSQAQNRRVDVEVTTTPIDSVQPPPPQKEVAPGAATQPG